MAKREFTGVFIPVHIWTSKELIPAEKMILGEIDCLSKSTGYCDASRKHFAEWLNCTVQNITYYFEKLERLGFITVEKIPGYRSKIRLCNARFYENTGVNGTDGGGKRDLRVVVNGTDGGGKRDLPEIQDKYNIEIQGKIGISAKPQTPLPNEEKNNEVGSSLNVDENPKKQKNFKGGTARKSDYLEAEISEVVEYLNSKLGLDPKNGFRKSKATAAHIRQRIAENYTVDDIKAVIEHKCQQWANDPKMSDYLRPQTLFGTGKFEAYLLAALKWQNAGRPKIQQTTPPAQPKKSGIAFLGGDKSVYQEKQAF